MSNYITTKLESLESLLVAPNQFAEFARNIFQNKTLFKVKILTPPLVYTGDVNDPNIIVRSEKGVGNIFIFKGRIIDSDFSHENFLPDPCDLSTAEDQFSTSLLYSLHVNVILSGVDDEASIQPGSIIMAELDAGDNDYLYSLQNVQMTAVDLAASNVEENTLLSAACQSLADLFGNVADVATSGIWYYDEESTPIEDALSFILGIEGDIKYKGCDKEFSLSNPVGVEAQSNSSYGPRDLDGDGVSVLHDGLDFAAPRGVPVYASAAGKIVEAVSKCEELRKFGIIPTTSTLKRLADSGDPKLFCGPPGTYNGNTVIIEHEQGFKTFYLHLDTVLVEIDQQVEQGEQIATIGSTGYSTGPHLHFELSKDGEVIDPTPYIKVAKKCDV